MVAARGGFRSARQPKVSARRSRTLSVRLAACAEGEHFHGKADGVTSGEECSAISVEVPELFSNRNEVAVA